MGLLPLRREKMDGLVERLHAIFESLGGTVRCCPKLGAVFHGAVLAHP
jgi:hypothetical protein